jgi:hypothetical protein
MAEMSTGAERCSAGTYQLVHTPVCESGAGQSNNSMSELLSMVRTMSSQNPFTDFVVPSQRNAKASVPSALVTECQTHQLQGENAGAGLLPTMQALHVMQALRSAMHDNCVIGHQPACHTAVASLCRLQHTKHAGAGCATCS